VSGLKSDSHKYINNKTKWLITLSVFIFEVVIGSEHHCVSNKFLVMGMGACTDEFVVAVGLNLWLWLHSMQLFQNIE